MSWRGEANYPRLLLVALVVAYLGASPTPALAEVSRCEVDAWWGDVVTVNGERHQPIYYRVESTERFVQVKGATTEWQELKDEIKRWNESNNPVAVVARRLSGPIEEVDAWPVYIPQQVADWLGPDKSQNVYAVFVPRRLLGVRPWWPFVPLIMVGLTTPRDVAFLLCEYAEPQDEAPVEPPAPPPAPGKPEPPRPPSEPMAWLVELSLTYPTPFQLEAQVRVLQAPDFDRITVCLDQDTVERTNQQI